MFCPHENSVGHVVKVDSYQTLIQSIYLQYWLLFMKHFVFLFIMEKSGYTQKEMLYVFFSLCWGRGTLVARPYDDQPSAVPGKSAGSLDRKGGVGGYFWPGCNC